MNEIQSKIFNLRRSGSVRHSPRLQNRALIKNNDDMSEEKDKKPTPSLIKGNPDFFKNI